MTSLIISPAFPAREDERARTGASRDPAPGPVLMADILTAPGGRPSLLTLWAMAEAADDPIRDDPCRDR